jgi:hypothetical protein
MKATIVDPQALHLLRVSNITTYLLANGWRRIPTDDAINSTWELTESDDVVTDIVVPEVEGTSDYALRVSEILTTLESIEGRSQLEIELGIQLIHDDLLVFRTSDSSMTARFSPLEDAAQMLSSAADMVRAAATAVATDEDVVRRRKSPIVEDFMRRLQLRYDFTGSRPAAIIASASQNAMLAPRMATFGRRVLRTFSEGVERAIAMRTTRRSEVGQSLLLEGAFPVGPAFLRGMVRISVNPATQIGSIRPLIPV